MSGKAGLWWVEKEGIWRLSGEKFHLIAEKKIKEKKIKEKKIKEKKIMGLGV